MESNRWQLIESAFHAALDTPIPERDALLERACGGDAGLRAEVAAMVAAHESETGLEIERALLAAPPPGSATSGPAAGDRVGAWRLVRPLGHGGMGEVWLAERADGAYEKRAAIKRVRLGWGSAALAKRFRRERQLLARLEHPNIAMLLDGGAAEDGEPFLAMEYVDGAPITAWCDARRLTVRDRLALFRQVCEAVRFAHANLVVHRDLKPANILVASDGRPVLLDFGIAKLLDPEADQALATRAEDRLLTPEYAAPEQLRGGAVTTATDVWGLGVLLHELLTGERPFPAGGPAHAEGAPGWELRRPSERVRQASRSAEGGAATGAAVDAAANRATTPAALSRELRGDLDAIVARALSEEPGRRYESAGQLGEDIARHLAGLPVAAQRDSAGYRVRKFARRHRVGVAVGAALAASLVAFGAIATWQAGRIAEERDRARAENARAERVLGVLVDVFRASDPRAHPGGDTLRVADLLRLAEQQIEAIGDEPLVRSRLWETVAEIHSARSEFPEQRRALARALAAADSVGARDLAIRIRHAQALLATRLEGARVGEPLLRASLAETEARFGPRDDRTASAMQDLANMLGDRAERLALLERSLALRREVHPEGAIEVAASLNGLGNYWLGAGNIERAKRYFSESHALMEQLTPPEHPDRLLVRFNLAQCAALAGRFAEANDEIARILAVRRRVLGPRNTAVAACDLAIGTNLLQLGRPAEAAESLAVAYTDLSTLMGPDHHAAIGVERHLAVALIAAGRREAGELHARHALDAGRSARGGPSAEAAFLRVQLAALGSPAGEEYDARALRRLIGEMHEAKAPRPRLEAEALLHLGAAALARPNPEVPGEAERAFATAGAMADTLFAPTHPVPACARLGLLIARRRAGSPGAGDSIGAALAACERWGMRPPGLLERARAPSKLLTRPAHR